MAAPGDGYLRVGFFTTNAETLRSTWIKVEDYTAAMVEMRRQLASGVGLRGAIKILAPKLAVETDACLVSVLEWGGTIEGSLDSVEIAKARKTLGLSVAALEPT